MIRLKIVLRNVIGKPLRTAIIILSLAAAAFTALFCISGINTAQNGLRDYFRANFGEADIMIYSYSSTVKVEPSAFPQNTRILEQTIAGITMTTPNPDYLNYVKKVNIGIVGMDTQSAYEMKLLERPFSTDGGVTVTEAVAKQFDKKVGDELSIKGHLYHSLCLYGLLAVYISADRSESPFQYRRNCPYICYCDVGSPFDMAQGTLCLRECRKLK